jgi:hypothetical protein
MHISINTLVFIAAALDFAIFTGVAILLFR